MSKRKFKNIILPDVLLTGVADKGRAVGRHEGQVVFVEGAVPGDRVEVFVRRKKNGFMEGSVHRLISPSPFRVEAFCEHFGQCGGCNWQHLTYEKQLEFKFQTVAEAYRRIGKVEVGALLPIVGARQTQYYRNKLDFAFSENRWLTESEIKSDTAFSERKAIGFHKPNAFNRVVDISHCYLQGLPSNEIRNALREFTSQRDYSFYDMETQQGYIRNTIIRTTSQGEVMVIVSFKYEDEKKRIALLDFLAHCFPEITSLYYVINPKSNDFVLDLPMQLYKGRAFIFEKLRHLTFKISPYSFFQTNTLQTVVLYDKVVEFAELGGSENVYDLYTGTGTIACYVAESCRQVVGIEEVAAAIEDAKVNAQYNDIQNAVFYAGDVKDILTEAFAEQHGKPDVVITDPPRAGMHPKVLKLLLQLEAPKLIYVSCNPATQARDFVTLSEKYRVVKAQPVDMFPHTYHIETVALLVLKPREEFSASAAEPVEEPDNSLHFDTEHHEYE